MLLYNGLHATIDYRIAHWFYLRRCFFIARAISQWSKMWTGIEIHPGATIGRRLVIDHGTGIVIGETAEIGDDCLLYQGVTLGAMYRSAVPFVIALFVCLLLIVLFPPLATYLPTLMNG